MFVRIVLHYISKTGTALVGDRTPKTVTSLYPVFECVHYRIHTVNFSLIVYSVT